MILASKAFFLFLLIAVVGYHLLRGRTAKYAFLLVASYIFYALCSPWYLWVLLLLTVTDFFAAKMIEDATDERSRRRWLILSIVSNLGLLAAFKYTGFAYDTGLSLGHWFGYEAAPRAWEILLPLGISFHTFQGISYTVDVYRRQIRAVRSLLDYSLFVAFFPQMAAGPIVRAIEFLPQLVQPPRVTSAQIGDGLHLVARGLFKKLVIADTLDSLFVSLVFDDPSSYTPGAIRWAVVAWAVQVYCDFSGYTDIAIGTAKWFGFELPANFHLPYLATSITDFWRRWHLSLSTWLRDYLYFPLGGSKGSAARTYFNLMTIFVLCGLWHGATWAWMVYGVYNGVLMSLHRIYDRTVSGVSRFDNWRKSTAWAIVAWAFTFLQLLLGLILIRMTNWQSGGYIVQSLFDFGPVSLLRKETPPLVPLLIFLGLFGHIATVMRSRVNVRMPNFEWPQVTATVLAIAGVVAFSPGVSKTFLYIQF